VQIKFNRLFLGMVIFVLATTLQAQEKLTWAMLGATQYNTVYENGVMQYKPRFPGKLEDLEGMDVVIAGYIIPVDFEENTYALSLNPFSNCFFCGGAGPETVMTLRFKNKQSRFLTDQYVMVTGRLVLNRNRPDDLFFILVNVELHG
jgi:hypothetical protein